MAFPAVKFNLALILHGIEEEGPESADSLLPPLVQVGGGGAPGIDNVSLWEITPNAIEYAFELWVR